ncbi:MAG: hypothetical protein PHC28_09275 [Flavobacterium sp.]|uniref:hypothetical protein n=1 Tax=Flavobacterium sp. TaxID=239 RepID=UPI00260EFC40|nr:hypothetical protein [Flavobacterium sp.]MDD5150660.1 hypothetical protein [Flavobacterium sp.]
MARGKKLNIFVRFGSLNLQKQKGKKSDTYHSPPASKGIYAFPLVLQERFLIGSLDKTQHDIFKKVKEDEYRDWDDYYEKLRSIRHVFEKKDGTIWHHLIDYTKPKEIIEINKSWVKTTIYDWIKIVGRASINDRMPDLDERFYGTKIKSFNQSNGICGKYSKDHYEVFFDEKI